ncbi:hypothetical protein SDC9_142768 [bioreactor metagenome]|uniref:Uncharacterized protein n=1 Tax=bioreactor metagenome TaxID=1076179 RepID=A0A645E488_9ZZZZ
MQNYNHAIVIEGFRIIVCGNRGFELMAAIFQRIERALETAERDIKTGIVPEHPRFGLLNGEAALPLQQERRQRHAILPGGFVEVAVDRNRRRGAPDGDHAVVGGGEDNGGQQHGGRKQILFHDRLFRIG